MDTLGVIEKSKAFKLLYIKFNTTMCGGLRFVCVNSKVWCANVVL